MEEGFNEDVEGLVGQEVLGELCNFTRDLPRRILIEPPANAVNLLDHPTLTVSPR